MQNHLNRRRFLLANMLSLGSPVLRALVTGLQPAFFLGFSKPCFSQALQNQYLILNHRTQGDPINANAPGTYPNPFNKNTDAARMAQHPTVAELGDMAQGFENPSTFSLGNNDTNAAAPWATLDTQLKNRMAFWHHETLANAHPEFNSVRSINGAIRNNEGTGKEEIASMIAQENALPLGTATQEPIALGSSAISFAGKPLAPLKPTDIKALFLNQINNIDIMVKLRDNYIDQAYKTIKNQGSPEAKRFLDNYGISRAEAAHIGDTLGDYLLDIEDDGENSQCKVAAALIKLSITPCVTLSLSFGGDNHNDIHLEQEVLQTETAVESINQLWLRLKTLAINDNVTFASLNTFGRTLKRNNAGGRNHEGRHHVMPVFGKYIKPGVIGGINQNLQASGMNASTGSREGNIDIPVEQTFPAVAKTLASATGIDTNTIEKRIMGGKIISGAILK